MSIHKLVLHAARAGTSKAEVPARADADMTGAGSVPYGRAEAAAGKTARADQTDGRTGDGQVRKKPNRGGRSRQRPTHDSRPSQSPVRGGSRVCASQAGRGAASRVRCDG